MSDETLPDGWVWVRLAAVADAALGKMLDRSKHTRGVELPYLRNQNVRWHTFDLSDIATMFFKASEVVRYGLKRDDVLICEGGEPGRAAVWEDDRPMQYQKALHRVRPGRALSPLWLTRSLEHDASMQRLDTYFTGSTIKHFTGRALAQYRFPLPPPAEQRRITAQIDALRARSAAARAALDAIPPLLDRFRQSVLAAAFRGDLTRAWRAQNPDVEPASAQLERLREERRRRWIEDEAEKVRARAEQRAVKKGKAWSAADDARALDTARTEAAAKYSAPERVDDSELPALPDGWCWAAAAEVVAPGTIITYGVVKPGPEIDEGIPYVRGQDVKGGTVLVDQLRRMSETLAASKPNSVLMRDDVILCIIGEFRAAIVPSGMDGANMTQGTVRMRPSEAIGAAYLHSWLESPGARGWMEAKRFGNSITRINVSDARVLPVPVAPLAEQAAVVSALEARLASMDSSDAIELALAQLDRLDQSILAKAFRGELVPQDPADEPASALLARIRAERAAAAKADGGKTRRRRRRAPDAPAAPQLPLPGTEPR